jgi:DNA repair protein RadC
MKVKNETSPIYNVALKSCIDTEDEIIDKALKILELRLYRGNADTLNSPDVVRDFLKVRLCQLEHEEFHCTWLDAQHQVISHDTMFIGTLTQASVYPREVVKAALKHNAAAVIFAHNHPSGVAEPSQSDRMMTDALKQALSLVDVRVLDHFIVAGSGCLSFAERGMI